MIISCWTSSVHLVFSEHSCGSLDFVLPLQDIIELHWHQPAPKPFFNLCLFIWFSCVIITAGIELVKMNKAAGTLLALHCDDGTATTTWQQHNGRAASPQQASSPPTELLSCSAVWVWRGLLALRSAGVTLPRQRGRGTELTSLSRGDLMSSSVTLPR